MKVPGQGLDRNPGTQGSARHGRQSFYLFRVDTTGEDGDYFKESGCPGVMPSFMNYQIHGNAFTPSPCAKDSTGSTGARKGTSSPMPHRRLFVSFLIFWILAGLVHAQVAGSHRGLLLGFSNLGSSAASALGQVDALGKLTSYTSGPSSAWPHWGNVWGAVVDSDNHEVLVPALIGLTNPPSLYGLVAWDPARRAVTRTLWSGPFGVGVPRNLTNLTLNSDGNVVSYDSLLGHMVELDRLTGLWSTTRIAVPSNAGLGGFVWDRLHGGYVYANSGATTVNTQVLLRTGPDRTPTTTLAATTVAGVRGAYGGDLLQNGDWISSALSGYLYLEVKAGSGFWRTGPASSRVMWDVTAEKYAAPGRGYYASIVGTSQEVVYVDAATTPHTLTTLITSTATPMPSWVLETLPLHDRDLCTRRTGKATWDLAVNPGNGQLAGKTFVVAASLAGAVPATRLADGRELFLRADTLTVLSAQGPVGPFLTGNVGVLDAAGRAVARLNLAALGTAHNGLVIHFAGVVLDAPAPGGIAWVLDPWAFTVRVNP